MRGLSAVLIVLYHFTYHYNESAAVSDKLKFEIPWGVWWGYAAVSVFFMLSGYLAGKYLLNTGSSPRRYLWHKARRLYPTYWVAMTLTSIVLAVLYEEVSPGWMGWMANLTMVSRLFGVPFVDGVYWTMQCELIFCIIIALLINVKHRRTLITILTIWVGVALLLSIMSDVKLIKPMKIALIIDHCHDFVAGIALYMLGRKGLGQKTRLALYTLLAMCVCNAVAWYGLSPRSVLTVISIMLIALSSRLDNVIPDNNPIVRALVWIATISYPLYLVHEMIGFTIMRHISTSGSTSTLLITIPIATVLIIACLIHRYVETRRK